MRVEKQRHLECMLATIAALSNTPLDEVRKFACKQAKVYKWADVVYVGGIEFWAIVKKIAKHYKVKGIPDILYYNSDQILPSGNATKELLQGRGSISIYFINNHTMPFEEGIVYDPEHPEEPLSIDKLLSIRYTGWKLINISRE